MSYARFGWGGSDVYVYLDVGGYLNCCACWLNAIPKDGIFPPDTRCYTTEEMVEHLEAHLAAGNHVPRETFTELDRDGAENDAWIAAERQKAEAS